MYVVTCDERQIVPPARITQHLTLPPGNTALNDQGVIRDFIQPQLVSERYHTLQAIRPHLDISTVIIAQLLGLQGGWGYGNGVGYQGVIYR